MASKIKRPDGRKPEQIRDIEMKVGVISKADGSAMFRIGNTIAIAAVYGPKQMIPKHMQDPKKAVVKCKYDLLPFSVSDRKNPAPSRRDIELSMIIGNALSPAIFLEKYPGMAIEVYVEIIQADAGTRCAGICAASLALANAGIQMKGLVGAIACGKIGDLIVVDLTKEEEDFPEGATDIPVAYIPNISEVTSLQLDGDITPEELGKAIDLAKKACIEIVALEEKAIKDYYGKVEDFAEEEGDEE